MKTHVKVWATAMGVGLQDAPLCEGCHYNIAVDVHHVLFRSRGGKDAIENLVGVCRKCHNAAHLASSANDAMRRIAAKSIRERKRLIHGGLYEAPRPRPRQTFGEYAYTLGFNAPPFLAGIVPQESWDKTIDGLELNSEERESVAGAAEDELKPLWEEMLDEQKGRVT
jgi:hypothetical protein